MNTKIVFLLLIIAFVANSCSKDKFTTRPQLTLKSVNSTKLTNGDDLVFTFNFTQKTGTLDSLYIKRISSMCADNTYVGTYNYKVPSFAEVNNQTGQITVAFAYNSTKSGEVTISNGSCNVRADTSIFKFCLGDNAGHFSDTITSAKITFVK